MNKCMTNTLLSLLLHVHTVHSACFLTTQNYLFHPGDNHITMSPTQAEAWLCGEGYGKHWVHSACFLTTQNYLFHPGDNHITMSPTQAEAWLCGEGYGKHWVQTSSLAVTA